MPFLRFFSSTFHDLSTITQKVLNKLIFIIQGFPIRGFYAVGAIVSHSFDMLLPFHLCFGKQVLTLTIVINFSPKSVIFHMELLVLLVPYFGKIIVVHCEKVFT